MSEPDSGGVNGQDEQGPVLTRPELDVLGRLADPGAVRTLVAVCSARPVVLGRRLRELYPRARLTVLCRSPVRWSAADLPFAVRRCTGDQDVLETLAALPAADLFLDVRRERPAAVRRTFRRVYLALADGGLYVARHEPGLRHDADDLADDARELARRQGLPTPERRALSTALELGLGRALGSVRTDGPFVLLRKRGEHVIKLDVEPTRRALAARGVVPRVLARVPPGRHTSASTVWSSDPVLGAERLPATVEVGELTCTVHEDVLVAPRQVAVQERLLLPTSYFLPWQPAHRTRGLRYHGPHFSAFGEDAPEPHELPGTYYHLDNQVPGHYGHVITHDLSKLWAWDAALAEHPDLRVLISPDTRTRQVPSHTYELLEAFGIGRDRVHVVAAPARVERLVTATQGFQQPRFLSPVVREVWARVVAGLLPRAGNGPLPERVFVGRGPGARRRCLNGHEVERRFVRAGFTVVRPEELTLPDQVRLFATASVVAGYAGSGLINTVFSTGPATRIVFASRSYWATNEYHVAAMYGGDLHYFWCDPVLDGNPSFHADHLFDTRRDGPALDALLRRLAPRRRFRLSRSGTR